MNTTQLKKQLQIALQAYENAKGTSRETQLYAIVVAIEAQITHLSEGVNGYAG